MKIAFIGAGKMGLPVCKRLKAAGHEVKALARRAEQASMLQALGFATAMSVAETVSGADIVFTCVSDDAALEAVLLDKAVLQSLPGVQALIDMSTVSPATSASIAAQLPKSLAFLRSPVSGSTLMAEAGTLIALVSGPRCAFDELAAILSSFSKIAFYLGEDEQARYLKLAINSMVAAMPAVLGEAMAIGKKGGLTDAAMLEVIGQSVIASPLLAYKKDMIIDGDYKPAATVKTLAKDMALFLATGESTSTTLPVSDLISKIYATAIEKGQGDKDFFVLVREATQ